jgi:hypothetical protein
MKLVLSKGPNRGVFPPPDLRTVTYLEYRTMDRPIIPVFLRAASVSACKDCSRWMAGTI